MLNTVAEGRARQVIEWFDLQYPLDVRQFCDSLGIHVFEKQLQKDGYLICMEGKKAVFIKADQNPQRKRFSISHELGHYFMHDGNAVYGCDRITPYLNNRNNIIDTETEANRFASELLIPTDKLQNILKKESFTGTLIKRISNAFNTSLTATCIKCVEKSLSEGELLIYYSNNAMKWFVSNGIAYINSYDVTPEYSLAREYFECGFCNESSRSVYGDFWGIEYNIYEEAIPINSHDIIVLLSIR